MTSPKVQLVDEEWPIGRIRTSPAPCLIGAADTGSNVRGGFQGQIDHAAVWNRPLSAEEIVQLSGGRAEVAKADHVILGSEKHGLQYWRPRGHNTWVGDVMPAFHDGRFHLFYLFDRRHHSSKWAPLGAGAHQFAHTSSTNLIDWEHHPLAVAITRQWETFGTGCPVFLEDRCEMHFGMHTFRMFPLEVTTQRQIEKRFVESGAYSPADMSSAKVQWPEQDVPVGHGVALSEDGIHFRKADINLTPSQNMWIFRNPPTDRFLTIWGTRLLTSGDLRHWKPVDDALLPVKRQTAANNSSECPCYFEWSGWHYVMMGRSGFWMARDAQGPYWEGPNKEDSRKVEHPRWDIYDGLIVPMAAPFKNNRRLLVGNTWSPVPHGGYAGYLVFRELIQHLDGTLGMKWPPEMIPPAGEPVAWRVNADDGGVPSESTNVRLQGDGFRKARIDGLPPSYRFTANVVPSPKVKALGVNVKARANYADGCELQFEPGESHAQWGTPSADGLAQHIAFTPDADSPHAPHRGLDFALDRVEGLDRPFKLDLIVQCDPTTKITLADACIDERRTMITHRYDLPGDALFLFVKEGEVRFEDIAIRPLLGMNREKR